MKKQSLTEKQMAQRTRDCKVTYGRAVSHSGLRNVPVGSLVSERMQEDLDKEREEKWVPEEEIEAMPVWKPVIQPVVARLLGGHAEVAKFMKTVDKGIRVGIVKRLVMEARKELPGKEDVLIGAVVWRALFELQKNQGVVLKEEIEKVVK